MKLMLLSLFLFTLASAPLKATDDPFTKSVDHSEFALLKDMQVNKADIEESLKLLNKAGKISDADYKKAMDELKKMNQNDVDKIKDKAMNVIENDPSQFEAIKKKHKLK